jgi:hypothetical protein
MPSIAGLSAEPPNPTESVKVEPAGANTTGAAKGEWKDDSEKRETMIRLAAYTFYERRGLVSGHELEDWLQAEMEVDRQMAAGRRPAETK